MSWGWFRGIFGGRASRPHPVLLRVRDPQGRPVDRVHVQQLWSPSGKRKNEVRIAAHGLCLIPWVQRQTHLTLVVEANNARTTIEVDAAHTQTDRVVELMLVQRVCA